MLSQLPELDVVFVSVGGGGLIAGKTSTKPNQIHVGVAVQIFKQFNFVFFIAKIGALNISL